MTHIASLHDELTVNAYGGKATNLSRMMRDGLPVPGGTVVSLAAFEQNGNLLPEAKVAIEATLDANKLYAVRSSALAEDAKGQSWAGQFESFLDTTPEEVLQKVTECHTSANARAKAYASEQGDMAGFNVAVVIQEMLLPQYAGVLFTRNPVSGEKQFITEYVEGLGESLVSGRADPKRVVLDGSESVPFDSMQLKGLAQKTEALFSAPQDIEWAWADGKMWLVQARPITTSVLARQGVDLGEPDELFYWGPSRANPTYMSDFMAGVERVMKELSDDLNLPTPPQTLVLFYEGKMVWLSHEKEFFEWCTMCFKVYLKTDRLQQDVDSWKLFKDGLSELHGQEFKDRLVRAWYATEMAEFSLYGAESFIMKQLSRFDERTLPKIWGAFSISDKHTFLNALDAQLATSKDVKSMADEYPWIRDGYAGPNNEAVCIFKNALRRLINTAYTIQQTMNQNVRQ